MQTIVISTAPIDTTTDMESAAEQLVDIAEGDLVVQSQRIDRRARRATFTVATSRADRFRERLAASKFARFYSIQD